MVVSSNLTVPTLVGYYHEGSKLQGRAAGCRRVASSGGSRACVVYLEVGRFDSC